MLYSYQIWLEEPLIEVQRNAGVEGNPGVSQGQLRVKLLWNAL